MIRNKRIRSLTAITLIVSTFIFVFWAGSMLCVTIVAAQKNYQIMLEQSNDFADYVSNAGRLDMLYNDKNLYRFKKQTPGFVDYCMLEAIHYADTYIMPMKTPEGSASLLRNIRISPETAVFFYDKDGKVLHKSVDHIYFRYVSEDVWKAEQEEKKTGGNAFINLTALGDEDPYARFRVMYSGTRSMHDVRALRITGYMNGAEIIPLKLDYVTETLIRQALAKKEPDIHERYEDGTEYISHTYTVSGLDKAGLFEWQSQFDNLADAENPEKLVTIYGLNPSITIYDSDRDNYLLKILEEAGLDRLKRGKDISSLNKYSLNELTIFEARRYTDFTDYDFDSSDVLPEPDFTMVTAIRSYPLQAAVSQLRTLYIVSFQTALLGILLIRRVIKRNLIKPLEIVNNGIARGWNRAYYPDDIFKWREPFELSEHYKNTADKMHTSKNEINRLNTALEYAKTAELNRRQMTSNIAHELKTPLAIIHSYSEGLKEHIAEEKRDKYLDVILAESERMDAMVLEMLDLSRLEAGKVKLARDEFSVSELVKSVFDKLSALIEEKELQIEFNFADGCNVVADEARIEQVVLNFAANAIQYTPQGGKVLVKTYLRRGEVGFSVENEGKPLSDEELLRVWDSFYRADKSRNEKGTGLGLAISKSIIELHGGKLAAKNTSTGVEFSFSLPR